MIKDSTTRVQKYLDRLATAKGYHKECIHTFLTGDGEEISLLASDLKALVQFAQDASTASPQESRQSVPSGMCVVNAGALQVVINALRRDAEEGKVVRGEMADELLATVSQAPRSVTAIDVQKSQQCDAKDAARYRYLRDVYWGDDKEFMDMIVLQMNKIWDEKIDAAIAAQASKKVKST